MEDGDRTPLVEGFVLILVNVFIIYFIGFFSLVLGLAIGVLLLLDLHLLLSVWGVEWETLSITPPFGGGARIFLWAWSAVFFLWWVSHLRYDCKEKSYKLTAVGRLVRRSALLLGIVALVGLAGLLLR